MAPPSPPFPFLPPLPVTHRQVNGGTELGVHNHEQDAEESGSERARAKSPLVLKQELSVSETV